MVTSTQRDPRSIITPDAFDVSEALIGTPLASPRRRAAALAIDGAVIGFITLVTKSFALILGVVAAAFFMRAGFRRTEVRNSVFGRAMRFSVGCLGVFIAMVTAGLWMAFGIGGDGDRGGDVPTAAIANVLGAADLLSGLEAVGLFDDIATAGSIGEAEEAGRALIDVARESGMDDGRLRSALEAVRPEDASWSDGDWVAVVDRLLSEEGVDSAGVGERGIEAVDRLATLSDAEALVAYAALLESDEPDAELESALADRLVPLVAGDTLSRLDARTRRVERELQSTEDELMETEEALAEARGGGLFRWVRERLDDLGFGFGWAALYMTVFLSWWNGQTVGKRLLGIRVVRLDGEPINWWTAFERAGGYAAGLATGLLGFAQVWWDANRQAIHDRIVGTVVIRDGAAKVEDWESAL